MAVNFPNLPGGTAATKTCRRCGTDKPSLEFTRNLANADGLASWCRECIRTARDDRAKATGGDPRVSATAAEIAQPAAITKTLRRRYVAPAGLLELWGTIQAGTADGSYPMDMLFVGDSGTGKTEGAKFLAEAAGMPFVKVDAAAMTDPEAWFGTREVVAQNGVSVTEYRPSLFVEWVTKPCVLLIDEANRIRPEDCNVILPIMDDTHQVTNPLTGQIVVRHPGCYIILSGNRGLRYVGTYAIEPALLTRVLTVPFEYVKPDDEIRLCIERHGVSKQVAKVLVRFANEVRGRAKADEEMAPVSTREVLKAAKLIADGASPDLAVNATVIWQASDEGGSASIQTKLRQIWIGIRPLLDGNDDAPETSF